MLSNYKRRLTYKVTNNDFKMHVNGNASASLTSNNSTLTTNSITCGPISCAGTSTKPTQPSTASMYVGLDNSTAVGLEICCSASPYIEFTTIHTDCKGRWIYTHSDNSFNWQVGGNTTTAMKLLSTGLSVNGTAVTSDKRLKFNEKPLINAIRVINRLEPVKYDQTIGLIVQYTEDTPQFHQCGHIARKTQQIEELKHAVIG